MMRTSFLFSLIVLAVCIQCGSSLNSAVTLSGVPHEEEPGSRFRPCVGCGNGKCDYPAENCVTCPADCGACSPCVTKCGNGICEGNETTCNCPEDCGLCCVDGFCNADKGETFANCAADCTVNLNITVVDDLFFFPLPGSVVSCTSAFFPIGPLTSDTGDFSFTNIPPGVYTCYASKFSYVPNQVSITADPSFKNLTIRIPLGQEKGSVEGITYDITTNTGLPNTQVFCTNSTYYTETVLSDQEGQFVFPDLYPGNWKCFGSHVGYSSDSNNGTLVSGQHVRIDLTLRPVPASVSGFVTEAGTGAIILAPFVTCVQGNLSRTLVGNDLGHYVADNVDPGAITCTASKDGYGSQNKSVVVPPGTQVTLNFTLVMKASVLNGDITDSVTGLRIPGVSVNCTLNANNVFNVTGDDTGFYTNAPVSAGTWMCTASRDGFYPRTSSVQVLPGLVGLLPFVLDPIPATLSGVALTTDGVPVLGASVSCVFTILPNLQPDLGPTLTNSTGNFAFENILVRSALTTLSFTCQAIRDGFGSGTKTGTIRRGDQVFITIQMLLLGIDVTVKDRDTDLPVPGATVSCIGPTTPSGISSAIGLVSFSAISVGNYNCSAALISWTGESRTLIVNSNSGLITLTLYLQLTKYLISGRIIDQDVGIPLPTASFALRDSTGTVDLVSTTVNATGGWSVRVFLPGVYQFFAANGPNYFTALFSRTLNPSDAPNPITIRLAATTSTITGEVTDASTNGTFANALVDLFVLNGKGGRDFLQSKTSGLDGVYTFDKVIKGKYVVRITAEGYLSQEVNVDVARLGLVVNVDLAIVPDLFGRVTGRVVKTLSGASVVPIAGVTVTIINVANTIQTASTTTIADGTYFFNNIYPGRSTVTASITGYKPNSITFDVAAATTNSVNDITLQPLSGEVRGNVYKKGTTTGCGCFVSIRIYPTGDLESFGSFSLSSGATAYSLPDLPQGNYYIVAQDLNNQSVTVTITNISVVPINGPTTVNIEMP